LSWLGIYGHDEIALRFARANQRGRLGGSFLFIGPSGVGKRSFAFALAKTLLCENHVLKARNNSDPSLTTEHSQDFSDAVDDTALLESFVPCRKCASCRTFDLHQESDKVILPIHPDFHYLCKPEEKSFLPLELLVGDKENRMRSGLCYELAKTPYFGGRKIAVIDDADFFNPEGANSLLKTLEEPPSRSIIILIGTSTAKQLPTIRSRCQIIRFRQLSADHLMSILLKHKKTATEQEAKILAENADGSLTEAQELINTAFEEFRPVLLKELVKRRIPAIDLARLLNAFIDEAGKEASRRRKQLQTVFQMILKFYRELILLIETRSDESLFHQTCTEVTSHHHEFHQMVLALPAIDVMILVRRIERTFDALNQIDRNVNIPYIIESWATDLARLVY